MSQPSLPVLLALVMLTPAIVGGDGKDASVNSAQPPASQPGSQPTRNNRLAHATSPYLRQHQHNPVDWHEWGEEAFEKARREDKPVFLSIGYAACHWCHVMAHESFENPEIAAAMNRLFVNIKVDREERPDIDDIYMQATMAMNRGQGGWPMSVWLTPDRKPFMAGTYFPPDARYGRPGFRQICERIGELWRSERSTLLEQADQLSGAVGEMLAVTHDPESKLTLDLIDATVEKLAQAFDGAHGGLSGGGTNKFPPTMALDLFMRTMQRMPPDRPLRKKLHDLLTLTLDRMAAGGIYDHLGGGICRYSTDVEWHVPHFEKMLYDQALVSRCYVDAFQFAGEPLYARVAREIFDYTIGDLQSPGGGFYSTRDADSEGKEGEYYVWTKPQIVAALGRDDGELFCGYYDVRDGGNWDDPHEPGTPKNVLRVLRDLDIVAQSHRIEPADAERRLAAARRKLLDIRGRRVAPALDDKILCEWNGLMISSLARGGAVLAEPKYVAAAGRAADFILKNQFRDGRLLRSYRDGRTLSMAFLSDYAAMIDGLIELYEATFESRWLDAALRLNETVLRDFADEAAGGYFFTPHEHEPLITRSKDLRDGAVPSGNSVQAMNLLRLAALTGEEKLRTQADRCLAAFAAAVSESPWSSERFLAAIDFAHGAPAEIAIVGDPADARTRLLLAEVRAAYLPNRVIMLLNPKDLAAAPKSPLLEGRSLVDGAPAVYICRNYVCRLPLTQPEKLRAALRP
ncbi:hypothetical protein RAS1_19970 [Phycisphaerae bacterium RAS1]|nr:hypothetical protein RAS1_19970 [Phycisphaerae bacterium RAS1]